MSTPRSRTRWRGLLWFLLPIYAGVVAAKGWLLERGVLRQRRLGHPVISVGSVSAGGAGKTPVVIMLAELLQRRGIEVRILTRGYGRKGAAVSVAARTDPRLKGETGTHVPAEVRVDPEGDAREFGDEPMLMARRLPKASVWVGSDRYRAGRVSERGDVPGGRVVYVLDDGFQHRKLARDVDIVLVTRQDVEDRLLPVGNLREPLKAVRRADVVVVREDEASAIAKVFSAGRPVWVIRRRLVFPHGVSLPRRPVVFCGLARPEGFLEMLRTEGIVPAGVSIFRDHHAYSERDVDGLVEMARANGADGFVTTEKDAVKLMPAMLERLGVVVVAELRLELEDEEGRMEEMLKMVHGEN